MEFKIIPNEEIDRLKWDSCVHYATQPAFSGYTWFLNAISKNWIGIVEGDYETVLPIFWQHTWHGGKIYHQPSHLVPTGPFSQHIISRPRVLELLRQLPEKTRDVLLVWDGQIGIDTFSVLQEDRHLLKLYEPFTQLQKSFDFEEDLTNLWDYGSPTPEVVTQFWADKQPFWTRSAPQMHRFRRIIYQAMHRGLGFSSSVSSENGKMEAAAFFVASHGYLFRLISAHNPTPKGQKAMIALYRLLIQTHAGRPVVLDFNADPVGAQFGAEKMKYTRVHN